MVFSLADTLLRDQKTQRGKQIESLARATNSFAKDIGDLPEIQSYAKSASRALQDLAKYVTETDVQDILRDAKTFAQDYPIAMAASALAVGYNVLRSVPVPHFGRSKPAQTAKASRGSSVNARAGKTSKRARVSAAAQHTSVS